MSKIYTLYHNNCPDGFGSALAAYLKFGDKVEREVAYLLLSPFSA
jgi:hypothetical protein